MATPKMQRRKPGEHPVSSGTDKPSPNLVPLGVNRTSMGWTNDLWAARRNCDACLLCDGGSEPLVYSRLRRRVCNGIGLRLSARRMALRDNRGNLDHRRLSALAHTLIMQLHNSIFYDIL